MPRSSARDAPNGQTHLDYPPLRHLPRPPHAPARALDLLRSADRYCVRFRRDRLRPRLYALLGVACAIVGAAYPKIFHGVRDLVFTPLRLPRWMKPALGALAVGAIAVFFPAALGMGYGYVQQAIDGEHTIQFLLLFAVVEIVATLLTISSGGSGGVFGPSLVIGGALGAAFGQAAQLFLPALSPEPSACILVAMGGFFAGVAKVPFASVIMVMEMTGSYGLLVPSLLVAAIAYLSLPPGFKLYENQLPGRTDSPAHLGSFAVDILRLARVGESLGVHRPRVRTVTSDVSLTSLMALTSEVTQALLPVVDDQGRLVGEISIEDIRRALLSDAPRDLLFAVDLMRPPSGPLVPDDDLATAATLLAERDADAVTVVRTRESSEVFDIFSRHDLIVAYGRQMERLRQETTDPAPADVR